MKKTLFTLLSAATLGLSGPAANAQSIAIPDPSFEINTGYNNTPDYTNVQTAGTGWTGFGSSNYETKNWGFTGQTGSNSISLPVENGTVVGTTPSTNQLTTTLSLGTYAANTTYTFTVAAVLPNQDDNVFARISLLGDANAVAATFSKAGNTFASGNTFQDITTSFTTGASGGFVGQEIRVQIAADSMHQYGRGVVFDNLRLTGVGAVAGIVSDPYFTPVGGAYSADQSVSITTLTSGATIHYTTDGSPPTTGSPTYSSPLTVASSQTIKALAVKSGSTDSAVTEATYTFKAATPTPDVAGGTYNTKNQTVTLNSATPSAVIYYTTNGDAPDNTINSTEYTAPIVVSDDVTIRAIAYKGAYDPSDVWVGTYTFVAGTPVMSPLGGTYTTTQNVTISSSTATATIRYTTDGSTPDSATGTIYSGPVAVAASQTLKAIAYESGYADSSVSSAAYIIDAFAATIAIPDFSFEINTGFNNYPDYTNVQTAGAGWTGFSNANNLTYNSGYNGQLGSYALSLAVENGADIGTTPSTNQLTTTASLGTYAPNTTYIFTVAAVVPNQNDTVFARISLLGDAEAVASTFSQAGNVFASGNTFEDITTSFTTGASGGFVGQEIRVQIAVDSMHQYGRGVVFDNLRLTTLSGGPSTSNYASWASDNSVTGGANGDSDNDGIKNLVEYALADGTSGTYTGSTLSFTKRGAPYGSDVTYAIEESTDLSIWTAAAATQDASTISYVLTGGTKKFARLKVTQP